MREVARVVPPLDGISAERFARAIAEFGEPQAFDADQALNLVNEAATRSGMRRARWKSCGKHDRD